MAAPVIFRAAAALSRRVARRHRRVTASACWASVTPRGDRGVGTTAAAAAAGGSPSRDGVGSGRNGGGPLPIPPPLRTYYADWAEVILPDGHRFPMEKYSATRLVLEADPSLRGKMELLPSPVRARSSYDTAQSSSSRVVVSRLAVSRRRIRRWLTVSSD